MRQASRLAPSARWRAGTVVMTLIALAACGQEGTSGPQPTETPQGSQAPSESSDDSPPAEVMALSRTPDSCSFPAIQLVGEPTFPLVHGQPERRRVQGVSLLLTTASPTEEPAAIEITRRVVGCVGTATVEVPADEVVEALGLTLQISAVASAIDVPNRAAVTVTVIADPE